MEPTSEKFADTRGGKALNVKTYRTEKMTGDEGVALREKHKLEKMSTEEGKDLKDMVVNTMLSFLANNTPREVLGIADSVDIWDKLESCLLYTSPSPRDGLLSRMPSSA